MNKNMNETIDRALSLYENGQISKAEKLCKKILRTDGKNIHALITLGNIYYIQNDYNSAENYYKKAVSVADDNYPAMANLANCLYEEKKYKQACNYAQKAIDLKKDDKLAYIILGNSSQEIDKIEEAVSSLLTAVNLDPTDSWAYNYLSQAYFKQRDYLKAISCAWKAVKLSERNENAHHINLGYLFYEIALEEKIDSMVDCIKLWVKNYKDNPIVNYMGNALLNNQKIKMADTQYLQNIFDIFSTDFDSVLSGLDYKAPALIEKMLGDIYKSNKHPRLKILDIGCGTGLCGKFLKSYSKWRGLDGVDISEGMLKIAKTKKIYSRLIHSEMISYLQKNPKTYDLMVAADVFTYVGDLQNLFEAVYDSLKKNGRILFTISENTQNDKSYYLHISGRFVHSLEYIKFILNKSMLEIEKVERKKLRNEGENNVMGYVISAIKK